jgi:amino-acid N-acetyltransferase
MEPVLTHAQPADLPAVLNLLAQSRLPSEGVAEHFGGFLVAHEKERAVGAVGLEIHGHAGLLRSLVVDPAFRGTGLGIALTQALLKQARRSGLRSVFLLTETAGQFFPRFGFRAIARAEADPAVRESVEFVAACPQSAVCMALHLAGASPAAVAPLPPWGAADAHTPE